MHRLCHKIVITKVQNTRYTGAMADNSNTHDSDKPGLVSKTLTVTAYPAAALIGYTRARSTMDGYVYDNIKDDGAIKDIRGVTGEHLTKAEDKLGGIHAKRREAGRSAVERIQKGIKVDFPAETREMRGDFEKAYAERLKMLSLDSLPQKWKMLEKKHQRWPVIMNGLEAAAITLGAMLFLAENKKIARVLNGEDNNKKGNDAPAR
jgi:hypothetical protein